MKKKINVILTTNNKNLGNTGKIIKVSSGFAFNYLIPNNLAKKITKGIIKHNNMLQNIQNKQVKEIKKNAEIIQNELNNIKQINIYKKTGDYKQIFGSITEKEIINKLYRITGIQINKKSIHIPTMNTIGLFSINIILITNINIDIPINILPENI